MLTTLPSSTTDRITERRLTLSTAQREALPLLALWTDAHDGFPPPVTRKHAARLRHLNALHAAYGPLVLLRLSLPALDRMPLFSRRMSDRARLEVAQRMTSLEGRDAAYTADVQRGPQGHLWTGTHAHVVTPLVLLPSPHREVIHAAPWGPGGGIELPSLAAHGVVILPTLKDREKVARYNVRHPDGRLDDPTQPVYLQALEDECARRAARGPGVRLGWSRGL